MVIRMTSTLQLKFSESSEIVALILAPTRKSNNIYDFNIVLRVFNHYLNIFG
jgi:hypothetical protein